MTTSGARIPGAPAIVSEVPPAEVMNPPMGERPGAVWE